MDISKSKREMVRDGFCFGIGFFLAGAVLWLVAVAILLAAVAVGA